MAVNARKGGGRPKSSNRGSAKSHQTVSLGSYLLAATTAHQAGRLDEAKAAYQAVLAKHPNNADALQFLGVLVHQEGDSAAGLALLEKAVKLDPTNAAARNNYGGILRALKRYAEAEMQFAEALRLAPYDCGAMFNRAVALFDLGRLDEAAEACESLLAIAPDHRDAARKFGQIDIVRRRYESAEQWLRGVLAHEPDNTDDLTRLAIAVHYQGRLEEARRLMDRAVSLPGGSPELRQNLHTMLSSEGRDEAARERYRDSLREYPTLWASEAPIAVNMIERGQAMAGQQVIDDILAVYPDDHVVWSDIGALFVNAGRYDAAIPLFEHAIELDPTFHAAYGNLGSAYLHQGHSELAAKYYRQGLKVYPGYAMAQVSLTRALRNLGDVDQAHLFGRGALDMPQLSIAEKPGLVQLFRMVCDFDSAERLGDHWDLCDELDMHNLAALFLDLLVFTRRPEELRRLYGLVRKWAAQVELLAGDAPLTEPRPANTDGKIHLGLLSSDLRSHSVARFLLPLIEGYDRSRLAIHCYAPLRAETDSVQLKIKGAVDSFRYVDCMTMRETAQAIRADGVDVLLELNGFTSGSRLAATAYKPAPVQISWLGYPFTCGLKAIDYVMMDRFVLPSDESLLVEQPLVMPDTWLCFGGFPDIPIDPVLPMERNGVVTFGTLNNPYKFDRELIALWADVMNKVPNSRFLLVRPEASSLVLCRNLSNEFAKHGIGADRILMLDNRKYARNHLDYYNDIDVSLDCFPVTGGTTTCEALWMGVPVVSLVGEAFHQRVSYSILMQAGLAELCVSAPEDYVERAVALANDRQKLKAWRTGLRGVVMASPLCDEPRFLHQFQEMLEQVVKLHGLR